jgi:hypothetical protein
MMWNILLRSRRPDSSIAHRTSRGQSGPHSTGRRRVAGEMDRHLETHTGRGVTVTHAPTWSGRNSWLCGRDTVASDGAGDEEYVPGSLATHLPGGSSTGLSQVRIRVHLSAPTETGGISWAKSRAYEATLKPPASSPKRRLLDVHKVVVQRSQMLPAAEVVVAPASRIEPRDEVVERPQPRLHRAAPERRRQ